MRSLPAILLAALTVVVIAISAFLTASHFGMRDWPTPPMPDTATRLITPTEAAERMRERLSKGDDPVEVKIAVDAGSDARRTERPQHRGTGSRTGHRTRRPATRRGDRSGRRSGHRSSSGPRSGANANPAPPAADDATGTPADQQPAPQPAPAEPSTGEQAQARPDDSVMPTLATPTGPTLEPVVPQLPAGGEGDGSGQRRGPVRDLVSALP
jgi:hypothetical protein